jgi:hypothetical protein
MYLFIIRLQLEVLQALPLIKQPVLHTDREEESLLVMLLVPSILDIKLPLQLQNGLAPFQEILHTIAVAVFIVLVP